MAYRGTDEAGAARLPAGVGPAVHPRFPNGFLEGLDDFKKLTRLVTTGRSLFEAIMATSLSVLGRVGMRPVDR